MAKKRALLSKPLQVAIFRRDAWLCRWCAKPVIFAPAMKLMDLEVRASGPRSPLAYYHPNWTRATAPLLDELGAVLDHVTAFSAGGECAEENLVTACSKCNVRKSASPLDAWNQRVIRKPIKGKYGEPQAWDGMSGMFIVLAERHATKLSPADKNWLKALRHG